MQFSKNTSIGTSRKNTLGVLIKVALVLLLITGAIVILSKIEFPSPSKKIEKTISNEKLKIVK
jgi:hypothetical protein